MAVRAQRNGIRDGIRSTMRDGNAMMHLQIWSSVRSAEWGVAPTRLAKPRGLSEHFRDYISVSLEDSRDD